MTDNQLQEHQTEQAPPLIGSRLRTARDSLGLSITDVSYQLRLSEDVINSIETDQLPGDIPEIFARGYLRTYGKFLNIPEAELNTAIKTLLPKEEPLYRPVQSVKQTNNWTKSPRLMQLSTSLIAITLIGLVVSWWFNQSPDHKTTVNIAQNKTTTGLPTEIKLNEAQAKKNIAPKPAKTSATTAIKPNNSATANSSKVAKKQSVEAKKLPQAATLPVVAENQNTHPSPNTQKNETKTATDTKHHTQAPLHEESNHDDDEDFYDDEME